MNELPVLQSIKQMIVPRLTRRMQSSILWQNNDKTVTLLDIPYSISQAQNLQQGLPSLHLLSVSPRIVPFPSNEPKSDSAKARIQATLSGDEALHADYQDLLERALKQVQNGHAGLWCLPRPFVEESPRAAKKRKLEGDDPRTSQAIDFAKEQLEDQQPGPASTTVASENNNDALPIDRKLSANGAGASSISTLFVKGLYSNDSEQPNSIQATTLNASNKPLTYLIPPKSSFYLGDCSDSRPFHTAVRTQAKQNNTRTDFDLILLDPPWPNRSVKRTHKSPASATYATTETMLDMRELLLDTKLDVLVGDDCLLGIWITNKSAVRDLVLGEDGVFACWNVELVAEWIWIKTTAHGEPITKIDALWRKPYEILLLGRRRRETAANVGSNEKVRRRVIIGVPDLHSRKPCLKEFIEPLMPDAKDYRALEVFARNLIAGWWTWGNECIKFNWERYWQDSPQKDS